MGTTSPHVLLALGIFIGTATTLAATSLGSTSFSDIPAGSYYDESVGRLYEAGIIKGNPDGTYRPGANVTRADVAVMLDRLRDELQGTVRTSARSERQGRSSSEAKSSSVSSAMSSKSSTPAPITSAGAFRFTAGAYTVAENGGTAAISVVRIGGNKGTVTVTYEVKAGTATAGSDFDVETATLTFATGDMNKTFTVKILDDSSGEGNETVLVTLRDPTNSATLTNPSTATITITDNESGGAASGGSNASAGASAASSNPAGQLSFSATQYAVQEQGETLTVTVVRAGGSTGTVGVNYATANGSGQSGTDYTATSGTLTFNGGETTKTFTVPVINDTSIEGGKTFTLTLSSPTGGATIDAGSATATIFDEESMSYGSGSIKFSKSTYQVLESVGKAVITVVRTSGALGTATASYDVTIGSAAPGLDYSSTSGTLTFAPGEAAKTFKVPIIKDSVADSGETANLHITAVGNAEMGSPSMATLQIDD